LVYTDITTVCNNFTPNKIMASFSTLLTIAVVLIVCVVGMTIVQQREQAKAKLRQQIAKYRYRANEAANILENFSQVPIGLEARQLLLQYVQLNLSVARKLAPSDAIIAKNLHSVNIQLKSPASNIDKQRLKIPQDLQQLNVLIQHLSKLGKYLMMFKNIKSMNTKIVNPAVTKITLIISEAKICAYIQQAKTALQEHNYVSAQRGFQVAQQMLDRFSNKNSRLVALESELKELANSTPQQAANTSLSIEKEHEYAEADKQNDTIFGKKKKW